MTAYQEQKADQLAGLEAARKRLDEIQDKHNAKTLRSEYERLDRRVTIAVRLDELFGEARTLLDELSRMDVESWSDLSSSNLPRGLNTTRRSKNRASCVVAHLGELGYFFDGARVHGLHCFADLAQAYLDQLEQGLKSAQSQETGEDAA